VNALDDCELELELVPYTLDEDLLKICLDKTEVPLSKLRF
jgi:hypothetical protein